MTEPATRPGPIPRLTGIDHIGLTVPDLDAATLFFADVLAAQPLYDIGPFASPDDWMASHLAGHTRASIRRLRVFKVANGPVLEVFELNGPEPRRGAPATSEPGGWHIAFYVEDMDAALAAVKAHGCEIQSGPVEMTQGPSAGLVWLYFKSPWGLQLELVSYPGGIAAYKALAEAVWRPQ